MAQKNLRLVEISTEKEVDFFQKSCMKFCIEKVFFDAKSDEKGCS